MKQAMMAAACCALVWGSAGAQTESEGPNIAAKDAAPSPTVQAIERAHLANELAAYGREERSAMAMIVAAQLQQGVGGRVAELPKTSEEPPTGSSDIEEKPSGEPDSIATLLADAREFAGQDESLLETIDLLESERSRGLLGEPAVHVDRAEALSIDSYELTFRGEEMAAVSIVGDGDTDLDLEIVDQHDNVICADTELDDRPYCSWTPAWTGTFTVRIANLGDVYNEYTLRTN